LTSRDFFPEFQFQTSRSGGAGGQNVNKVESRVTLRFHVDNSALLTEEEKQLIKQHLRNRISQDGYLQLHNQTDRSQLRNKELVVKHFYRLLEQALLPGKERRATRPTHASVKKRIAGKKKQSEKKAGRSRNFGIED
jgi:ribosome-associated protein